MNLLAHFFLPRHSNNQKALFIQSPFVALIIGILIACQLLVNHGGKVLGYAAQISSSEVIRLTNEKRAQAGLPAVVENSVLSQAAHAKGVDMVTKGYWAHVAPDGTQPWAFFSNFGYRYRYAGENLARDFSNPHDAVEAWMASPTHRENMLSPKYKEIGIGVVDGKIAGADTTIIVQFFGTKLVDTIPVSPVAKVQPIPTLKPNLSFPLPTVIPVKGETQTAPKVVVSPFTITKGVSFAIAAVMIAVIGIDAFLVHKRRIIRVSGRSFAHFAFLGMVLVVILIVKSGLII